MASARPGPFWRGRVEKRALRFFLQYFIDLCPVTCDLCYSLYFIDMMESVPFLHLPVYRIQSDFSPSDRHHLPLDLDPPKR